MKKKKVCIFGGSFDPIHFGHISLCVYLSEQNHFDEVIFSPAYCSPFKTQNPPKASGKDRLTMIEMAIEDIEGFVVNHSEVDAQQTSYTIDLVKDIAQQERYRDADLYLLLANDTVAGFHKWESVNKILSLTTPVLGISSSYENILKEKIPKEFLSQIQSNFIYIPSMDVRSTDVRNRLKKKLYCGHLLHAKVLDYISKHQLYSLLT